MKEDTVRNVGFARLAIFRPGIIVGNAHTPAWVGWLGSLVPGSFGNIDQRILGRSIAAEIAWHSREAGEITRENAALGSFAWGPGYSVAARSCPDTGDQFLSSP